jgi:hypothetical protein
MDHGSSRLHETGLANVVTFLLVRYGVLNHTCELFVAATVPQSGVQIVFAQ